MDGFPKEYKTIAAGLSALALLAAALFLAFPSQTPAPSATPAAAVVPEFVEVSGLQIAQSAAKFLDSMKKSDGTYILEKDCDKSSCVDGEMGGMPQSNAWAAFAHIGLYRATKDKAHVDAAKREVGKEMDSCSGLIPSNSSKTCVWALVQPYEVYRDSNDSSIRQFLLQQGFLLLATTPPQPSGSGMIQGISARELAIFYGISGYGRGLDRAVEYIDSANKALDFENRAVYYDNATGFAVRNDECWVKLAELELYRVTKNESFLRSAQGFFDKAKLGDLSNGRAKNFDASTMLHPCVESLEILADATGKNSYDMDAKALAQYLAESFYDSPAQKNYDGQGGFALNPCSKNASGLVCISNNQKPVTDNAYNAFLFSVFDASQKYKIYPQKVFYGPFVSGAIQLESVVPAQASPSAGQNRSHYPSKSIGRLSVMRTVASDALLISYLTDGSKTLENPVITVNGKTVENLRIVDVVNTAENWTVKSYDAKYPVSQAGTYRIVFAADGANASEEFVWS